MTDVTQDAPLADRLRETVAGRGAIRFWTAVAIGSCWIKRLLFLAIIIAVIGSSAMTGAAAKPAAVVFPFPTRELLRLAIVHAAISAAGGGATYRLCRLTGRSVAASLLFGLLSLADIVGAALPLLLGQLRHRSRWRAGMAPPRTDQTASDGSGSPA